MVAWYGKPAAGLRLRLAGAALVTVAGLLAVALHGLRAGAASDPTGFDCVLALAVLGAGLAGIALLAEGAHLFDPVPLPPRLAVALRSQGGAAPQADFRDCGEGRGAAIVRPACRRRSTSC